MECIVSDVRPEQLAAVEEMERRCFSLPWTIEQLEHQMTDSGSVFLAACRPSGELLGYVGMKTVLDEGYIANVAASPEHRREGVADALLNALLRRAQQLELAFLTLEVRRSNAAAIALYTKHGYKPVGLRKNYYSAPAEDAILMTKFLK